MTETIRIEVTESGSRVVKRNIEDIGKASEKSADSVDILKKALGAIGIGLALNEIYKAINAYTQLQNQLKVAGIETNNLAAATDRLLQIANKTRQSIGATGTLYARLSGAAKELGADQESLYKFIEATGAALAVNGTETAAATGVLIQLSQAMGGAKIQAQEFNSIVDGARPLLAAAAKNIDAAGGSVSKLKTLVNEGKITSQEFFQAVVKGAPELEAALAKSSTTIGQAMQVLSNEFTVALGRFDEANGFSKSLSDLVLILARNIGTLIEAVVNLGKAFISLGAGYAAFKLALKADAIITATGAYIAYLQAVKSGAVVVLGSAEAERQKAVAQLAAAEASAAEATATAAAARANLVQAEAVTANTVAVRAALTAELALEQQRLRAQINDLGRQKTLTRMAELRVAELQITRQLTVAQEAQAVAATQAAAAENALATAAGRVGAANATAATATTAAAGSTGILATALGGLRTAFATLNAVILANPFAAILAAIIAVVAALTIFRDQIQLGTDEVTTLGDFMRAAFELIQPVLKDIGELLAKMFGPAWAAVKRFFGDFEFSVIGFIRFLAKGIDFQIGLWEGLFRAIIALFRGLPGAVQNYLVDAINGAAKKLEDFINRINQFVGRDPIKLNLNLPRDAANDAKSLGQQIGDAFGEGFGADRAQKLVEKLAKRAQEIGFERSTEGGIPGKPATAGTKTNFGDATAKLTAAEKLLASLQERIAALKAELADNDKFTQSEKDLARFEAELLVTRDKSLKQNADLIRSRYQEAIALEKLLIAKEQEKKLNEHFTEMDQQIKLLQMERTERERLAEQYAIERELKRKLTDEEARSLEVRQKTLEALQRQAQLRDSIEDPQKQKLQQINDLGALKEFTDTDPNKINSMLVGQNQEMFKGTIEEQQAQLQAYQDYYAQIDAMRNNDLISEQTAQQLKLKADAEYNKGRLEQADSFFGSMALLSKLGNKKLAQIGKAAALVQATIKGYVAVQEALASAPPPANIPAVVAAGVQTAANIAGIVGTDLAFRTGGSFVVGGGGGPDSQMVAFRATPGEQVSVNTPEQARAAEGGPVNVEVPVTVVNTFDPQRAAIEALRSGEGRKIILNTIDENARTVNGSLQKQT